ncbi:MAG: PaaI family thioesterase [Syntrophomonadaceae bacterium]|nr:PaaI family thioesterase [Syntrophomonadaceae bacterium]
MAVNKGIETWLFETMEKSIKETPFYKLLGVELVELGPGEAVLKVFPTAEHTNPLGMIHGGLLMSIADAAMGNAVRSLGSRGVTVDMSTSFLSSAMIGQEIIARGKVLKAGRNLFFVEATVTSNEKLLVKCTGTFFKTGEMTR